MIGDKKLATIRQELREAFAREGANPIASLDRRIRALQREGKSAARLSRSLLLVRDALAQVVAAKPRSRPPSPRARRPKKAV